MIIKIKKEMNPEVNMLIDLNTFTQHDRKTFDYHMKHIRLVRKYILLLNKKLGGRLSNHKLSYIALAHDILKEKGLDQKKDGTIIWKGHNIPQDTNSYVRKNLNILERYGLDDYFNTDVQFHALAAGIFIITEFGITDPEIIYPIFFHSCPIIPVYESLPTRTRTMVDITMLADKLSSNYLRINYRKSAVRVDLDQVVFGSNGLEFNYTLGLFMARLIGQGKSEEEQSTIATEYFYKRLCEQNPLIARNYNIKRLGGNGIWPRRKSQVWMTP